MNPDQLEKHLHNFARYQVALLSGVKLDKKMLRFNDVVAVGTYWHSLGENDTAEVAEAGVVEAIEMCIPENIQYVKNRGPLTSMVSFGPHGVN